MQIKDLKREVILEQDNKAKLGDEPLSESEFAKIT